MPENTIPAFLHALSFPEITTLELDVVISKDDVVVVSHEPWFNPEMCQQPSGKKLDEEKESLRKLTAQEIAAYDCGQLPHPRFPEQAKRPATKPTLLAVFAAIDAFCRDHERPLPYYNIEIKYEEELEPEFVPDRETFVKLVVRDIKAWGHPELVTLQCFDPPTLVIIRAEMPEVTIAYLDEFPGDVANKMNAIGFIPPIYSPYEIHVTAELIAETRAIGMKTIPWTVNDTKRMRELVDLGVDGIITDYPNRIPTN